eukprot:TRINITY_DN37533_c0_g1_i2.p1 TRINITY_DN37533_c0_g1~~TRINITY_DN37533_c0_g1_i2.p1  ORF type:complete len:890 (+),score=172.89 TRINITY_DN37533_c0_g1_i2:195-2864(+)
MLTSSAAAATASRGSECSTPAGVRVSARIRHSRRVTAELAAVGVALIFIAAALAVEAVKSPMHGGVGSGIATVGDAGDASFRASGESVPAVAKRKPLMGRSQFERAVEVEASARFGSLGAMGSIGAALDSTRHPLAAGPGGDVASAVVPQSLAAAAPESSEFHVGSAGPSRPNAGSGSGGDEGGRLGLGGTTEYQQASNDAVSNGGARPRASILGASRSGMSSGGSNAGSVGSGALNLKQPGKPTNSQAGQTATRAFDMAGAGAGGRGTDHKSMELANGAVPAMRTPHVATVADASGGTANVDTARAAASPKPTVPSKPTALVAPGPGLAKSSLSLSREIGSDGADAGVVGGNLDISADDGVPTYRGTPGPAPATPVLAASDAFEPTAVTSAIGAPAPSVPVVTTRPASAPVEASTVVHSATAAISATPASAAATVAPEKVAKADSPPPAVHPQPSAVPLQPNASANASDAEASKAALENELRELPWSFGLVTHKPRAQPPSLTSHTATAATARATPSPGVPAVTFEDKQAAQLPLGVGPPLQQAAPIGGDVLGAANSTVPIDFGGARAVVGATAVANASTVVPAATDNDAGTASRESALSPDSTGSNVSKTTPLDAPPSVTTPSIPLIHLELPRAPNAVEASGGGTDAGAFFGGHTSGGDSAGPDAKRKQVGSAGGASATASTFGTDAVKAAVADAPATVGGPTPPPLVVAAAASPVQTQTGGDGRGGGAGVGAEHARENATLAPLSNLPAVPPESSNPQGSGLAAGSVTTPEPISAIIKPLKAEAGGALMRSQKRIAAAATAAAEAEDPPGVGPFDFEDEDDQQNLQATDLPESANESQNNQKPAARVSEKERMALIMLTVGSLVPIVSLVVGVNLYAQKAAFMRQS